MAGGVTQIKGAILTVEGRGFMGMVDEVTLPSLAMNVGEHRAMGYDAPVPIDLGMEMLSAQFTMSGPDFGLAKLFGKNVTARMETVLEGSRSGVRSLVSITMGGKMTMVDMQSWSFQGELSPMQVTMGLDYYMLSVDGLKITEIDVPGGVRFFDGFDALAEVRGLLGV
jgi:hypothetical protein